MQMLLYCCCSLPMCERIRAPFGLSVAFWPVLCPTRAVVPKAAVLYSLMNFRRLNSAFWLVGVITSGTVLRISSTMHVCHWRVITFAIRLL